MKIDVLDHGYVRLIEAWGHGENEGQAESTDFEVGIIEAARQSTQGNFRGWDKDEKLLKYLLDHRHASPFEFSGMVLEVQAPIFVFREWHRHRTQSYNEMSARYAPLPDLYYTPNVERMMMGGGQNKQAGAAAGADVLTEDSASVLVGRFEAFYAQAEALYQSALMAGMPKELARCVMPVAHYSRMRASANLRNWLQFITLRCEPDAQWEIRMFAEAVRTILQTQFPVTLRNYK